MVIKNILLLQVAKVIDLAIPILCIPIVVNNLGLSEFGSITKILAISAYFVMIGEWGFNTNLVSYFKQCEDRARRYNVYVDVLRVKLIYVFITALLMSTLSLFGVIGFYLTFVTTAWVASAVLQARWYFQSIEQLPMYTAISIVSKSILVLYIFLIMDTDSSKETYLLFNTIPIFLIALFGNFKTYQCLKDSSAIRPFSSGFCPDFIRLAKEGWNLVSSRLISNMFNPMVIMITSYYYDDEVVGILGVFQKVVNGVVAVFTPINEVFYPRLASCYKNNKELYKKQLIQQVGMIVLSCLVYGILLFSFIEELFNYFNLSQEKSSVLFLAVYSLVVFTNLLNMALVNALVVQGKTKYIAVISSFSVSLALIIFFFSVSSYSLDMVYIASAYIIQQVISLTCVSVYYRR